MFSMGTHELEISFSWKFCENLSILSDPHLNIPSVIIRRLSKIAEDCRGRAEDALNIPQNKFQAQIKLRA